MHAYTSAEVKGAQAQRAAATTTTTTTTTVSASACGRAAARLPSVTRRALPGRRAARRTLLRMTITGSRLNKVYTSEKQTYPYISTPRMIHLVLD